MPKRAIRQLPRDWHRIMSARHFIRDVFGTGHIVVSFDKSIPIGVCGERIQRGEREGFDCADFQALTYLRNGETVCEKCVRYVERNPTPL